MSNTVLLRNGVPEAVGEGRVQRIDIDPCDAHEAGPLSDEEDAPIVFNFRGPNGFYINVYDHRPEVKAAFLAGDDVALIAAFKATPCLVGYRIKDNVQYIVIVPIGTADVRDGGPEESLVLTMKGRYEPGSYRCIVDARGRASTHIDTGISLVKPKSK